MRYIQVRAGLAPSLTCSILPHDSGTLNCSLLQGMSVFYTYNIFIFMILIISECTDCTSGGLESCSSPMY